MKPKNSSQKKNRSSVTFRIQEGSEKLLSAACRATGKSEGAIINLALLECGPAVFNKLRAEQESAARDLDGIIKAASDAHKKASKPQP